ncbi:MAG: aspartate aminotransferase family protein, partial [Pseudomonadota bacterium]|nr:aspartate aminotransferase family protein [Pseudomonadota bacterium]
EAALKMAKQYHYDNGEPQRNLFIAREQSFHGNTLGALSVGGNIWRRKPFEGTLINTHHIKACNSYRNKLDGESDESYGIRAADFLEQRILQVGPENVAAFVAETVGGATAGVLVPPKGYFERIREICDRYGVLLILDEVMCGMGRTGSLFAFEQESIQPDIVTMAKGLAGGYQPIGAVMCSSKIYECIDQGYGYFQHSHTYMGHAIACAAAMSVQKTIQEESLLTNVASMGNLLHNGLHSVFGDHPNVGDIRGRGMFRAIELVTDRASKIPFQASSKLHEKIKHRAMEVGLMCYPGSGTADGVNGHHVLLAPPFIAQPYHIEELLDKLNYAVTTALLDVEKHHE